jgi:hypothetical protein
MSGLVSRSGDADSDHLLRFDCMVEAMRVRAWRVEE